ncbi:hypothetical protein BCT25_14250 [Vibrio sp. 10N.261.45.A6]|uniref:Uncharacterized protein n=1 Tax=Vibrio splendidus TaxID=29497 RepID=A0A2N7CKQ3_VIBSP|nr:hypothetical protein BCV19_21110 [Vibrio splendidus]PML97092.1 hypothetical protein BCT66_01955 [Vibrio sp. 10N.261.49.E11]PMN81779.1 hypothetical protein BCT25_14250 [Vibrio sp. 10N.261.45.A6]PMN85814.1 hypothetical protein BCT22_09170 [Vibrio sp. 10N.261.45.A1]PMO21343.1 hypothetical protein BCT15_14735 [Vibrio splendidus]
MTLEVTLLILVGDWKCEIAWVCSCVFINEGADLLVGVFDLTNKGACDVKSYEALFTAKRVNHLYHQMNLGA